MATFEFPKKLPKAWIEAIERNGRVDSKVHGLKVVAKDKRGTIIHVGKDSFKILHNGKNQNVFGNPLVGLDPNFGYETGTSGDMGNAYQKILGSVFTITQDGTADSISAYKFYTYAFQAAIYKHSDLSLVGHTVSGTGLQGWSWVTVAFANPKPSLTANTAYILVIWGENTCYFGRTSGDTNQGHYQSKSDTYNWANPLVPTHENYKYCIYCTYTAAAPPAGGVLAQVM